MEKVIKKRLTGYQLCELHVEYYKGHLCENLRFGQYILNEYFPSMINPTLFHEKDSARALTIMLHDPNICSDSDYY